MKFKLENLPKLVQFEVFKYINANELLELRFLNKHIFNTIHPIIYEYLCYSYFYAKDDPLNKVQHDFIKKNPSEIKRLTIMDGELPDYLRIDDNIRTLADMDGNYYLSNDICDQYINLKSIYIQIEYYYGERIDKLEMVLNYFRKLLFKVEELSINTITLIVDLDSVLPSLNPDKLKVLKIGEEEYENRITLSDISKFSQFKYLECLEIYTNDSDIESNHQSDSNTVIFPALKRLKLDRCDGIDFGMFGNIPNLEELYLDQYRDNLDYLPFFNAKLIPRVYLECYIGNFSPSNSGIDIYSIKYISTVASKISLLINGNKDTVGDGKFINMSLFLNVDEITFSYCHLNIHYIFNMLEYFPNIKKVTFKDGQLYAYFNTPLRLPNNPKSFLFCIEINYAGFNDTHIILPLLETVPTYMY